MGEWGRHTSLTDGDGIVVVPDGSTTIGCPIGAVERRAGAILRRKKQDGKE